MYSVKSIIIQSTILRTLAIAFINILFYSKTVKSWFEKTVFNPYEIDGNRSADYALSQLNKIVSLLDINGKDILEIGPGGNYYLACLLLKNGARKVFVIDNENHNFFSDQEIDIYRKLYPESIGGDKTINQDKIVVLHYGSHDAIPLSNYSIDIIFSNAVLEHVYRPKKLLEECSRILKIGGQMMHQIDYRDHIFNQKSLFFLNVPDILFDLFFKNTGMWVNRLRHSEWISLYQTIHEIRIVSIEKQEEKGVHGRQRKLTDEDFKTTSALFLLEKYVK